MTISMYQASVPNFMHKLNNLAAIIEKAIKHAEAKKIDSTVLAAYRLAPDMLPLSAQVQIACDTAKGCGARLAGVDIPKYDDSEKTLPELKNRIEKTVAFLSTVSADQIDGSEEKAIVLQFPGKTFNFTGLNYLNNFATPNFYFHVTAAYAILRHAGVELGKQDFLGSIE